MKYKTVKPFVKWAGGKSQLLSTIREKYPKKIDKYCEPFVGGGAVLFDVLANCQPKEVLINDINAELVNTYSQIKNNVDELIEKLSEMQETFWSKNNDDRKVMYLAKRERFNDLKVNGNEQINLEKAALFIFLNKTCFNGLYRVNRKGLFNVPIGSYKKPPICDAENLKLISGLLKNVQIKCGDYSECADFIDENTFVYIDPPYRPLTATASFTSYSENEFGDKQQIELGKFVDKISSKGAKVVVSNSDPKNSDESDSFFDDLYSSYTIMRVPAKRMINSKATGRGNVNELLICNFCGDNMNSFDYDIALSFAGEDRTFVEKCAEILRSLNINVFYDNNEKHVLLGKNLYSYLADLYHNRAKFAAVFISKAYKEKLWTNHELEFITERRFEQKDEYLLPIKLDETHIEEIPSTVGYIVGDSPLNVALTIAKKINSNMDFKLMINELKYLLPNYNIEIMDDMVNFDCPSESFEASYPLGFMMELYRHNLIEPLFVGAAIVPN